MSHLTTDQQDFFRPYTAQSHVTIFSLYFNGSHKSFTSVRPFSAMPFEIKNTLLTAGKNSLVLGVTGIVRFLNEIYLSYLKFKVSAVGALYRKVKTDPRLSHAKLLLHS